MLIIAHRGWWWPDPERQNTPGAIAAALAQGWAVEFDVRDLNGALVLQHDEGGTPGHDVRGLPMLPPGDDVRLFWHPKDRQAFDGIVGLFLASPTLAARSRLVDVELLDAIPADKWPRSVPLLVRCSEREGESMDHALAAQWAQGIWLDTFTGTPWTHAAGTRPTYLVSPELHGHPLDLRVVKEFGNLAGVCTDLPHLYAGLTHEACTPKDKWWGA